MADNYIPKEPASFSTLEELDALIREAEESGEEPIEMTPAEWQRLFDDAERESKLRRKAS